MHAAAAACHPENKGLDPNPKSRATIHRSNHDLFHLWMNENENMHSNIYIFTYIGINKTQQIKHKDIERKKWFASL